MSETLLFHAEEHCATTSTSPTLFKNYLN